MAPASPYHPCIVAAHSAADNRSPAAAFRVIFATKDRGACSGAPVVFVLGVAGLAW
jgi:hypothetical protein